MRLQILERQHQYFPVTSRRKNQHTPRSVSYGSTPCPYCGTWINFSRWRKPETKLKEFQVDNQTLLSPGSRKCRQCKKVTFLPVYKLIKLKRKSGSPHTAYVLDELHAILPESLKLELLFKGNKGYVYDKLVEVNQRRQKKGLSPLTSIPDKKGS